MKNVYNKVASSDLNVIEKSAIAANTTFGLCHLFMTQPHTVGAVVGLLMLGVTGYGYVAKRSHTIG